VVEEQFKISTALLRIVCLLEPQEALEKICKAVGEALLARYLTNGDWNDYATANSPTATVRAR
jgi:hypothetical protein